MTTMARYMAQNKCCIIIIIIIKKAFDTVDHSILVTKLDHYGIRGVAKKWLSSYLENRKQYEMNTLSTWFKTNRLSLNVSKTNCIIFGRSNQPDHHRVYIDNIVIKRVNCNKFIGVIIDSKLSWSDHVSCIRHKMSTNLSVMHRVKWLLNNSALYMIYCTLVLPYISYCCEIWGNTYKTRVEPLYIIQKRAIRIILNIDRTLNLLS